MTQSVVSLQWMHLLVTVCLKNITCVNITLYQGILHLVDCATMCVTLT